MPVTCAHLSVSSLPQHFVCLPLSVEIALLALSTSQYFVYLPLSIQRLQARSKYILVCSSAPSLAHKACTRYTERPNLRFWLPALRSTLFICHFRYNACRHAASTSMYAQVRHPWRTRPVRVIPKGRTCASGSQLPALGSQLSALCSRLSALGSRLSALGSQLPAPSSQLSALSSQLSALSSQLSAPSSQLPAPSSQLPAPSLQFSKQ